MKIILCDNSNLDELTNFYNKIVLYLEKTVNYPKWVYNSYPCRETVFEAIQKKVQYACLQNGKIVGAFILNDDPQGKYENANIDYKQGEYLVIHTLATDYELYGKGIASYMVKFCIAQAKIKGYKALYVDIVPTNFPAKNLYKKCGFTYLGDFDLERGYENIPTFSLCELKL